MTDSRYEFCEVFVKDTDRSVLEEMLAGVLGVIPQRGVFDLGGLVIDVVPNGRAAAGPGDDFVLWPWMIEIEAGVSVPGSHVVEGVGRILTVAWESGRPAVAACDYEDELPWAGGLQRL